MSTQPKHVDPTLRTVEDAWSFSEWTKQHKAEERKLKEQRKALFEKVLASMGGGSSDVQEVRIPHDLRTAMLERPTREGEEEQAQKEQKHQKRIEEQRVAQKKHYAQEEIEGK